MDGYVLIDYWRLVFMFEGLEKLVHKFIANTPQEVKAH
jgi:hypothetical protein